MLPVAEFRDRVRDFDGNDTGLASWIRVFSLSLSRCEDACDAFAISLLEDVDDFKAKRASNIKTWRNNKRDETIRKEGAIPGNHLAPAGGMASSAGAPAIPTVDEMYAYARSKGLDDILAREWYDMTTERGWTDRDGCPVHAWKKMLAGFVRQRDANLASKKETT